MRLCPILLDDREQASGLPEALKRVGLMPTLQRLPLGDLVIGERLIIERKTAADFAASLADGRLADQLARLAAERDRAGRRILLILEGPLTSDQLPGIALEPLREALLSIQLDWRVPLLMTADLADTARWIALLARHIGSGAASLGSAFQPAPQSIGGPPPQRGQSRAPRPSSPRELQLAALAGVEGLGRVKARTLLDRFGSIHALKGAGEDAWRSVPGIGPEAARALREFFQS